MFLFDSPKSIRKPVFQKRVNKKYYFLFKDTHREKAPSNKIPALTKSMSMDIWVIGTSIQLCIRSYSAEKKLIKIKQLLAKLRSL